MHIGLIGGIGVPATIVYCQSLSAAVGHLGGKLKLTFPTGTFPRSLKTTSPISANRKQRSSPARLRV